MTSLLLQALVKLARVFRQTFDVHKPFAIFVAASMKCGCYFHAAIKESALWIGILEHNIQRGFVSVWISIPFAVCCLVVCRIYFPFLKFESFIIWTICVETKHSKNCDIKVEKSSQTRTIIVDAERSGSALALRCTQETLAKKRKVGWTWQCAAPLRWCWSGSYRNGTWEWTLKARAEQDRERKIRWDY